MKKEALFWGSIIASFSFVLSMLCVLLDEISIAIVFLVVSTAAVAYIIYIIIKDRAGSRGGNKRKGAAIAVEDVPTNHVTAVAKELSKVLIEKGFSGYLLSDYTIKTRLTERDLFDQKTAQAKLNLITAEILNYLRLPVVAKLVIRYESNPYFEGKRSAGSYKNNQRERKIDLSICKGDVPINTLAILCHECTHFFMEKNRLNIDDTEENEIRTDITANLIGFNDIMIRGYNAVIDEQTSLKYEGGRLHNVTNRHTRRYGYISSLDCIDISSYLDVVRRELEETKAKEEKAAKTDKANKEALDREKEKLEKGIAAVQSLLQQLSYISVEDAKQETQEEIMILQACLSEYESRDINKELELISAAMDADNAEKVREANTKLEGLSVDILRWIKAFQ